MSKKAELLAPVGSEEVLYAAVRSGADAVYLGASEFSARRNAKNFTRDALKKAVEYCHQRDVKVYLAVNTLLRDREFSNAMDLIKFAADIFVDAVIVQDIGLAHLIRKAAPDLKIHGSTQMAIHTPSGAKKLREMGFSRVVLARELSKDEIIEIRDNCDIELEIFIHGALCMSVSGQCYLSAMLGGRSGNRGLCAQPCRLPFNVSGGTGHDLSLKDLCMIDHIKELETIGITSLKIEGRMKRPEYVAAAVDVYRDMIDKGRTNKEKIERLKSIFSRSGFTDGYYTSNLSTDMFGIRQKEDVLGATESILKDIRSSYKQELKKILVSVKIRIREGEKAVLTAYDDKRNEVKVEGPYICRADKVCLDKDKIKHQLMKTGGTAFLVRIESIDIEEGTYIRLSELNDMRREALYKLSEQRIKRRKIRFNNISIGEIKKYKPANEIKVRARFPSASGIDDCFKECELIYVPLDSKAEDIRKLLNKGFKVGLEIPRIIFSREEKVYSLLNSAKQNGINDVWIGNIGVLPIAKKLGFNIHAGFSLNLFNTYSLNWAKEEGILDSELSFELSLNQIKALGGEMKRGIVAYGRMPLMITRNCPAKNGKNNCSSCNGRAVVKDRKNMEFPLVCSWGCTELLNTVPVYLGDKLSTLEGIDFVVLRFTVENSVESAKNYRIFNSKKESKSQFTRGIYTNGVE